MAEQGSQANSSSSSPAPPSAPAPAPAPNATAPAPVPNTQTTFPKISFLPQNAYVYSTGNGTYQIVNIAQPGGNNRQPQPRLVPVVSGQTPMAIAAGGQVRPILAYPIRPNGPRAIQVPITGTGPRGQTLTLTTQPQGTPITLHTQRHPNALRHPAVAISPRAIYTTNSTTTTPTVAYAQTGSTGTTATPPSMMTPKEAKDKGVRFLTTILTMAQENPNVLNLIQSLLDGTVQPEEFTNSLQKELNCESGGVTGSHLAPFLTIALPAIRYSIMIGETTLKGVRPPPMGSVRPPAQLLPTTITLSPSTSPAVTTTPNSNQTMATQVIAGPNTNSTSQQSVVKKPPPKKPRATTPRKPASKTPKPMTQQDIKPSIALLHRPSESPVVIDSAALAKKLNIAGTTTLSSSTTNAQSATAQKPTIKAPPKSRSVLKDSKKKEKQSESFTSALRDDDDVNDVAAMGGVNLAEETQRIMAAGAELVGTQIRSCKDEPFLDSKSLTNKIAKITSKFNLERPSTDIVTLISHAAEERLKNLVERLGLIAQHRAENLKLNPHYEVTQDVRGQVKFLAELDRIEKRRHEEQEREILLRAAKSRSKLEDPEQLKLKQKAKEMQRAEQEEVRQREANETALLAIGPRKKLKTSDDVDFRARVGLTATGSNDPPQIRRVKRVNLRDLQFLFEHDLIFQKRFEYLVSGGKRFALLSATD